MPLSKKATQQNAFTRISLRRMPYSKNAKQQDSIQQNAIQQNAIQQNAID
jgi:hypothetical protein